MKKILSIICALAILCSLSACGGPGFDSVPYVEAETSDMPTDTLIAENAKFTLEFNPLNAGFVLTDKNTGERWSSIPEDPNGPEVDEDGMPIKKHPRVESMVSIECKNFISDTTNAYYSYTDVLQLGKLTHTKIDGGIVLKFFFSEAQVMIPLECTLTEQGVNLRVDPKKIMENDNKVITVSIAPFFCGVKNDTEDSYIFVPSGSGAIAGVQTRNEEMTFSAEVYGHDPAIDEAASPSTKEAIRLGVFGAKTKNQAVCAIIDSSAASAKLNVTTGSPIYKYSAVYPTFIMRGYTNHIAELYSYEKVERLVYAKQMIDRPISVTYYPLSNEDANYGGMAETYRDYLIKNYGMSKTATDVPLNVRVIGGAQVQESFLGIPYKTVHATTTLTEAEKIMNELKSKLGNKFTLQLKGYGESGIDVGKTAGN